MDKKRSLTSPVGASSLLVILAVLCLTVFAVLALTTAGAGRKLAQEAADAVSEYYSADCAAEEILALIRLGQTPPGVTESEGVFCYTCPISETQELEVAVQVKNDEYIVIKWQSVPTGEWSAQEDMEVWDGQAEKQEG